MTQQIKKQEGSPQKKLTITETSSETQLENSEIANNKESFFRYSDVCKPNQKQSENLDPTLNLHDLRSNLKTFAKRSKIQLFKNPM